MDTELIAQCVGALGVGVFLFCYHFKDMKNVLKVKLLVDVIWGVHYFLLGAYSGFAMNMICCVRELVFMNNDKGILKNKIWLWIFVALNYVGAALTWKGFYSIMPAVVSTLATFSFWQKDVKHARKIGLANNALMFTYDAFVSSYMGMVGESLSFFSVLIAMYRNGAKRNQQ